jgi:hypothetical protein
LYADVTSKDGQFLIRAIFLRNQKYEYGGWLKFKIHVLSYGENLGTFALT